MLSPELAEELELIAMEATRGQPVGPGLCRSLERDVTALLYRSGMREARVIAEVRDGGLYVTLLLPTRQKRVQKLVMRISEL